MNKLFPKRFSTLKSFIFTFITLSFVIRFVFLIWSFSSIDFSLFHFLKTFIVGFLYDLGTISFFAVPFALYLLVFPKKYQGSIADRVIIYFSYFIGILIFVFSFFAEITFWEEFKRRFNFIAVDYLIYTYEVVQNINQSYPLPILISAVIVFTLILIWIPKKSGFFKNTFQNNDTFAVKILPTFVWVSIAIIYGFFIQNKSAEWSTNRYENEISKTGIYSFFAAFRNNELNYNEFYITQNIEETFKIAKKKTSNKGDIISDNKLSILHDVISKESEVKPNVILIFVESLSAKFMDRFGNNDNITPFLDSLATRSISFDQLYATGTRTVRGMEAVTLSVPPTPGRSVVKRKDNTGLFTIGEVFKQKGYTRTFFYGGDGYFDNMNQFFGGNGFDIVDRGRGFLIGDNFKAKRTNINDDEVAFENAWGISDEDIFNKVIQMADQEFKDQKPFFNFVMTTSNHRPYTYPSGKIDIPSGTGRKGAVKYTDYAIGAFIKNSRKKLWFKNTVFIIMADHCASSAGKSEVDIANYHIPALIFNLPETAPQKIEIQCSQIDVFPTLFGYLNWSYASNFYGKDVNKMDSTDERALIGNYQKLGLLKGDKAMILGTVKTKNFYQWDQKINEMTKIKTDDSFLKEAISYYQSADYLFQKKTIKSE